MTNVRTIAGAGVIKPLVSVVALIVGLGAMALSLTIQHHPHLLTQPKILPDVERERLDRHIEIPLVEMTMFATRRVDSVIRVDEVRVEGRKPSFFHRRSVAIRKVADARSLDRQLMAPCKDGEYRKLDPHRGVRLMCPGGSL